jgi:hypothetical protein
VGEDTLPYAKFKFMHYIACKQLIEVETAWEEGTRKGILVIQSEYAFKSIGNKLTFTGIIEYGRPLSITLPLTSCPFSKISFRMPWTKPCNDVVSIRDLLDWTISCSRVPMPLTWFFVMMQVEHKYSPMYFIVASLTLKSTSTYIWHITMTVAYLSG